MGEFHDVYFGGYDAVKKTVDRRMNARFQQDKKIPKIRRDHHNIPDSDYAGGRYGGGNGSGIYREKMDKKYGSQEDIQDEINDALGGSQREPRSNKHTHTSHRQHSHSSEPKWSRKGLKPEWKYIPKDVLSVASAERQTTSSPSRSVFGGSMPAEVNMPSWAFRHSPEGKRR